MDTLDDVFFEPNIALSGDPLPLTSITYDPVTPAGDVGFPPSLPLEVALQTAPFEDILAAYHLTPEQYFQISLNPLYVKAVAAAQEALQEDGAAFKLKAKLQAEEMLKTSWKLVHDNEVASSVRADLIKATVRWAGYEPEKKTQNGVGGGGPSLNIQINLG